MFNIRFRELIEEQECIPVGCVPPAAVAVRGAWSWGMGGLQQAPPGPGPGTPLGPGPGTLLGPHTPPLGPGTPLGPDTPPPEQAHPPGPGSPRDQAPLL